MASNGRSCATKHARSFAFSLAMVVCKPCGCNVPASLLAEHNRGWKHLQNVIANDSESTDPSTLQKPPSSFQDSQPVSLQTTSPAISAPTSTSDSRVAISHEGGLDFVVEGTEVARRISFPPVDLAILIKKTEVVSSLSISAVQLFISPGTPKSWCSLYLQAQFENSHVLSDSFKVFVSKGIVWQIKPRRILMSFRAPYAGTFRASLRIAFSDNTRPNAQEFTVSRELCGRATLPSRRIASVHPQKVFPRSNRMNDHADLSTEEADPFLDSQGTGISVSNEDGVKFSIVKRDGLTGSFNTSSSSVTITHAKDSPAVTFVGARIKSREGGDSRWVTAHYRLY